MDKIEITEDTTKDLVNKINEIIDWINNQ